MPAKHSSSCISPRPYLSSCMSASQSDIPVNQQGGGHLAASKSDPEWGERWRGVLDRKGERKKLEGKMM